MVDRLAESGAIKAGQESTATVGTVSRLAGAGQIEAEIRRLVAEGFYTAKVAAYTVKGRLINAALDAISIFSPSSLFANSEVGAWYDPSDLTTLYQDSAGTTPVTAVEQPVGLMLDKSQGLVLGSELVTNGTFDSDLSGWTNNTGATWDDGTVLLSATTTSATISQSFTTVVGRAYWVKFDFVSGNINNSILRVGNSAGSAVNRSLTMLTVGIGSDKTTWFVATATTTWITLFVNYPSISITGKWDNISVKELHGNHALQSTSASRPTLSARYNLLTYTEQFDNAAWTKDGSTIVANSTTAPDGTTTADTLVESATTGQHRIYQSTTSIANCTKSIIAKKKERDWVRIEGVTTSAYFDLNAGVVGTVGAGLTASITSLGDGWYKCSISVSAAGTYFVVGVASADNTSSYTGDGTSGIYIWGADLRVANDGVDLPVYQRVAAATDYDTVGFPTYLAFDGVDDSMVTNSIDFTGTDKMTVWGGLRKLTDPTTAVVAELSTSTGNNGSFGIYAPRNGLISEYGSISRGTTSSDLTAINAGYHAPHTAVLSGSFDIANDINNLRVNETVYSSTADQGTGNYGNYPLYIGRRGGTTLPLNGRLYSLIVRGAESTATEINDTEDWVNNVTKAY